jgi:hypothetical protein
MTNVWIVGLGPHLPLDLRTFAKTMNRLQRHFSFRVVDKTIQLEDLKEPPFSGLFYNSSDLFRVVKENVASIPDEDFIICVGAIRVVHLPDGKPDVGFSPSENEWFGIWRNALTPLDDAYARIGFISVAQWMQRFEGASYRTTAQYLCHMTIAFLGDVLFDGELTHPDFRWCVFDFNDDLESIGESVKKCSISQGVVQKIKGLQPAGTELSQDQIVAAFQAMAMYVRRPTMASTFRYLNESSVTQVFVIGILLSNSLNPLLSFVNASVWTSIGMGLLFVTILLYLNFRPAGRLG